MEIDKNTLAAEFSECNRLYFNNALKAPKFKLFKNKKFYACFVPGFIEFNTNVEWTSENFRQLMVHEMIHMYISVNKMHKIFSHGFHFRWMMYKINKKYHLGIKVHPQINFKNKKKHRKKQ